MWLQDRNGGLWNLNSIFNVEVDRNETGCVIAYISGGGSGGRYKIAASMEDIIQAIRTKAAITSLS